MLQLHLTHTPLMSSLVVTLAASLLWQLNTNSNKETETEVQGEAFTFWSGDRFGISIVLIRFSFLAFLPAVDL